MIAPVFGLKEITDRRFVDTNTVMPSLRISCAVKVNFAGRFTATPCGKDMVPVLAEELLTEKLNASDCGPAKTLSTTFILRNVTLSVRFGWCALMAR